MREEVPQILSSEVSLLFSENVVSEFRVRPKPGSFQASSQDGVFALHVLGVAVLAHQSEHSSLHDAQIVQGGDRLLRGPGVPGQRARLSDAAGRRGALLRRGPRRLPAPVPAALPPQRAPARPGVEPISDLAQELHQSSCGFASQTCVALRSGEVHLNIWRLCNLRMVCPTLNLRLRRGSRHWGFEGTVSSESRLDVKGTSVLQLPLGRPKYVSRARNMQRVRPHSPRTPCHGARTSFQRNDWTIAVGRASTRCWTRPRAGCRITSPCASATSPSSAAPATQTRASATSPCKAHAGCTYKSMGKFGGSRHKHRRTHGSIDSNVKVSASAHCQCANLSSRLSKSQ